MDSQLADSPFSLTACGAREPATPLFDEALPYDVAPQLSAFVTAFARTHLHVVLEIVVNAGGTILYADTDSIAYSAPRASFSIDPRYINEKLLQGGYIKETNFINELGTVKDLYPGEVILNTLFMSPKMYLVETTKGVYTKTAGVGLTSGWGKTDEAKRAWALLKEVVCSRSQQTSPVFVTSKNLIKAGAKGQELLSTALIQKNLAEGTQSEKRRHRVFNSSGEYIGTRPVHVVMSKEGRRLQQQFLPASSNCF